MTARRPRRVLPASSPQSRQSWRPPGHRCCRRISGVAPRAARQIRALESDVSPRAVVRAIEERDAVDGRVRELTSLSRPLSELTTEEAGLENDIKRLGENLRQTNALFQLLSDAGAIIEKTHPVACPVCERAFPADRDLFAEIRRRANELRSSQSAKIENQLNTARLRLDSVKEARRDLYSQDEELQRSQANVRDLARKIAERLGPRP